MAESKPVLSRQHIQALDEFIKKIMEESGYGMVSIEFKKGEVYVIDYTVSRIFNRWDCEEKNP